MSRGSAFAAALLAALLPAPSAWSLSAVVDRTENGELRVRWEVPEGERVDVLIYDELPTNRKGRPRLVSQADGDGLHVLSVGERRPYVLLRSSSGRQLLVAERVLPLEGGQNFRDLGGYETADGRRVRWGLLYRSGTMHQLTDRDYRYLGALGIRVSCDLRATEEREREPARWAVQRPPRLLMRDYALDLGGLARELANPALTADRARALFTEFYTRLPDEFADQYRRMFAELLRGEVPLAFNCSAGKDRTGVAAALILTALGVPREAIIEDYLLSNRYYAPKASPAASDDAASRWLAALSPDVRAVLLGVERAYLEAAFQAIETRYGSIDGYLELALGVDSAAKRRLRERFTERL